MFGLLTNKVNIILVLKERHVGHFSTLVQREKKRALRCAHADRDTSVKCTF